MPTYSLLAPSTLLLPREVPRPSSMPLSSPEPSQYHLRPLLALTPKARTPASPRIPIVPPAAKHERPQQRPAANCICVRICMCIYPSQAAKRENTGQKFRNREGMGPFLVVDTLPVSGTVRTCVYPLKELYTLVWSLLGGVTA